MPGEDLESDDEYLNPVIDDGDGSAQSAQEDEDDSVSEGLPAKIPTKGKKKRTRNETSAGIVASQHAAEDVDVPTSKVRKTKKAKSPRQLLLETSRGIAQREADVQAAFLWTCFSHSQKMGGEELDGVEKFTADNFYTVPAARAQCRPKSIADFLKSGAVSKKKLKKWKVRRSPMVVVVCLSARRAVAILKQLSSLNIRCAKLFPKNMNVEGQVSMLQSNSFGIAVGTPNRLLKLSETENEDGSRALNLSQTELIVIDCHEDHKRFTVCTLNDTAPDLMRFIRVAAVSEMQKRDSLKFAMY